MAYLERTYRVVQNFWKKFRDVLRFGKILKKFFYLWKISDKFWRNLRISWFFNYRITSSNYRNFVLRICNFEFQDYQWNLTKWSDRYSFWVYASLFSEHIQTFTVNSSETKFLYNEGEYLLFKSDSYHTIFSTTYDNVHEYKNRGSIVILTFSVILLVLGDSECLR